MLIFLLAGLLFGIFGWKIGLAFLVGALLEMALETRKEYLDEVTRG